MAKFSFYGNPVLSDTEFNEMLSNDKQLRELRYAIGYRHEPDHESRYHVNYKWDECRDVTPEQIETARKRYEQRRNEIRATIESGVLLVVTMGSDYAPNITNGIGNYRVRIQFYNKKGDLCGCEFCPFWRSDTAPDESTGFTFDKWNRSEEERKNKAYNDKMKKMIKKYGSEWSIPRNARPDFPMSHADRGNCTDLQFTPDGLITWLRREYGVKFNRAHIDRYFFNCDEITSEPIRRTTAKK